MLLAPADPQSPYAFDAVKDNVGMVVVGLMVLVLWLLFRKMLELSERKAKGQEPPNKP